MLTPIEKLLSEDEAWRQKCEDLKNTNTLSSMVWIAWQMGLWIARLLLEENLNQHGQRPRQWEGSCSKCGKVLNSKGFEKRRILTLVGWVNWRRQVGCCPHGCSRTREYPFEQAKPGLRSRELGVKDYQQTSGEVKRLDP